MISRRSHPHADLLARNRRSAGAIERTPAPKRTRFHNSCASFFTNRHVRRVLIRPRADTLPKTLAWHGWGDPSKKSFRLVQFPRAFVAMNSLTRVPVFLSEVPNFVTAVLEFLRGVLKFITRVPNFLPAVPDFITEVTKFGTWVPIFGTAVPFFETGVLDLRTAQGTALRA